MPSSKPDATTLRCTVSESWDWRKKRAAPPYNAHALAKVSVRGVYAGGWRRTPGVRIRRCLPIHPKVPYVKVHLLRAEHLHHCILAGRQVLSGHYFYPLTGSDLLNGCWDEISLLRCFPGKGDLQVADHAHILFHLGA